jgi:hypothetical protein
MSEGEILIFIVSLLCSFALCFSWIHQHTGIGVDGYPRSRETMAFGSRILCAGVLLIILKTRASSDVRDSPLYLAFYMMMGAAWVGAVVPIAAAG